MKPEPIKTCDDLFKGRRCIKRDGHIDQHLAADGTIWWKEDK